MATQVAISGKVVAGPSVPVPPGSQVRIVATAVLYDSAGEQIVTTNPRVRPVYGDGTWTATLYATDDAGTTPTGQGYQFEFQVGGQPWSEVRSVPSAYTPSCPYLELPVITAAPSATLAASEAWVTALFDTINNNVDGGSPSSVYLPYQTINGGNPGSF